MTTTTPCTGQTGSNSNKNGDDNASASGKVKAKQEAYKEKQKKKRQKDKDKKKNNNNNNKYVRQQGLIVEGIMKGVTINPGTSAAMATEFRKFSKSAAAYAAAKGWEHLPGVIETMEPVEESNWTTTRPDKR